TFAGVLAARYNGRNGHGYVDSFEIGNEEWDGYWGGSWANTLPCRAADYYGPVLKAGYQAVKAQSPTALVGMFGLWWMNTPHIQTYMTWLYQNGYGPYMDFANFHYYTGGAPSTTNGAPPSYDLECKPSAGAWATLPTPTPTPTPAPSPTPSPAPSPASPAGVTQPSSLVAASQSVSYAAAGKANSCRKGTVTATGAFTSDGAGSTVSYEWIRTDNRGPVIIAMPSITIAPGDTASHAVVSDSWNPNSAGSE